jgi:hypothetical protein
MSYKRQELFTLNEHNGFTPSFLAGSVLLIVLVFCDVLCFYILFVCGLCIVWPMIASVLELSILDCLFGFF